MIDEKKALELIAQGEGQHVEFKESVPSKVRELSEEVCAFSNATGGYVLIGVNNKSEFVKGFTIDNTKRSSKILWMPFNPPSPASSTRSLFRGTTSG